MLAAVLQAMTADHEHLREEHPVKSGLVVRLGDHRVGYA